MLIGFVPLVVGVVDRGIIIHTVNQGKDFFGMDRNKSERRGRPTLPEEEKKLKTQITVDRQVWSLAKQTGNASAYVQRLICSDQSIPNPDDPET